MLEEKNVEEKNVIDLFENNLTPSTFSNPLSLEAILIKDNAALMADSVCVSEAQDTFFINKPANVDSVKWMLPNGAVIASTMGDTMIVVNWHNSDTGLLNICVSTSNDCGTSSPTCFPIQVMICNDAPVAVNDFDTLASNDSLIVNVLNNDSDPQNDSLFVRLDSSNLASNGTLTLIGDSIRYTPNTNFTGTDQFNYVLCDNGIPQFCDTATVSVLVQNEAPMAVMDADSTPFMVPIIVDVQNNDTDKENGSLSTSLDTSASPLRGTVTVLNNDSIRYTPDTGFYGTDHFKYIICDNGNPALCDTTTVMIKVTPVNHKPLAVNDTFTVNEDIVLNGNVRSNDEDPDSNIIQVNSTPIATPQNGSLTLDTNGVFAYTPNLNFNGVDSFKYAICDIPKVGAGAVLCDTALVFINVTPVNDKPVAVDDMESTDEDQAVTANVLPNDTDIDMDSLSISTTAVNGPQNGTVVLNANGSYTYTPNLNFNGLDSFFYQVCDDGSPILCDTGRVIIAVNTGNDKPVAADDTKTVNEDGTVSGSVLLNDMDIDLNTLTVNTTPINGPQNGTVVLNANGNCVYTPNPNYNGLDSFFYQVCDNGVPVLCDTAKVIITVIPVNDKPVAVDDAATTNEDEAVSATVLPNDTDIDMDSLIVNTTAVTNPQNGTVVLNANGNYTYTPNLNYNGLDSFFYQVCDNGSPVLCDTAKVIITITPVNDKPVAVDDVATTNEDEAVSATVLPNDTDIDMDPLSVTTTPVSNPQNGTVVLNSNGTYTYTPNLNYNGLDSFFYQVCDNGSPVLCDTGRVTITITPVNDKPVAVDDTKTLNEDEQGSGSVLANDTDVDQDSLMVSTTPVNGPNNGTLVLNMDGTCTYTPNPNYNGLDTFYYQVCDKGSPTLCDTGRVIITVNAVNDKPVAVDDVATTNEDEAVSATVLPNDTDIDMDPLSVTTTPVTNPQNGTVVLNANGTYTYTPNLNYNGLDSFFYQVCDNGSPVLCDTGRVTITITPVNDKPVAVDDTKTLNEDEQGSGSVLTNDTDVDQDGLMVSTTPVNGPNNGTLVLNMDGTCTYTPNPNYNGLDTFYYQVCDKGSPTLCDTGRVIITVNAVNDKPVAVDDVATTNEDEAVSATVLPNDTDIDMDPLSVTTTPVSNPQNGTVVLNSNGTYTYTPNLNYNGLDSFFYQVCDNGSPVLCDTGRVTITITPVNDKPLAENDTTNTNEDTPVNGNVVGNDSDIDGDSLLVHPQPIISPLNGIVSIDTNGNYVYTPSLNFNGIDSFSYQICDKVTPSLCDTAWVLITVNPVNDAPYAINDVYVTFKNQNITGNSLIVNDLDLDGDAINIQIIPITNPTNGNLTIHSNGTFAYQPNTDFVGEDNFQYQICDTGTPSLCDTGTATIEVIFDDPNQNNKPVGVNDVFVMLVNDTLNKNILINDFDPDGDALTLITNPVATPANGSLTINANGTFQYIPNQDFIGDDYFTYQICDNQLPSLCDIVRVSITVIPKHFNNTTYAIDDLANTREDQPVSGDVLANDIDPNGHTQTINPAPLKTPTHGTVQINLDGTFTYTPYPNYFGLDQFKYLICDNGTPAACDSATVFISILSVNDAPIALEDINNTILNRAVDGNVLTNDVEFETIEIILNPNPISQPANGTVSLNTDGSYLYTPNPNFLGEDVFEYEICDTESPRLCDTTKVFIEVLTSTTKSNNPPNGVEDNLQTEVDEPYEGYLLVNDSDLDGDKLIINTNPIVNPLHGTVSIDTNGFLKYTPQTGFHGEDQFMYEVCDDGTPSLCDQVTVTIDVIPNPFHKRVVYATDDAGTMWENHSFSSNLIANDHNPAWDSIFVKTNPIVQPRHGIVNIAADASYTYTPFYNYNGSDQFLYVVCDDHTPAICDTATAYLTILPAQSAPIAAGDINLTLVNVPVSGQVLTNDFEPDGDPLIVLTQPLIPTQNGALTLNANGLYTYTPNTDFVGRDAFDYIVCDDQVPALCDTTRVIIEVIENEGDENHPPIGVADFHSGQVNIPLKGNMLINDSDPDGDPIKVNTAPISQPTNGALIIHPNGTYTYTPNQDYFGKDQFRYEVCDLQSPPACDTATVYLDIFRNSGNLVFANDDAVTGEEDKPITGNLLANDFDPQGDSIIVFTDPTKLPDHGVVTINSKGEFTYTPIEDYAGPDQFNYQICDNGQPTACDTATAYIVVLPVNDTLCKNDLAQPTLLSNGTVCITENIFLFIQENYPLVTIENTVINYQFIWYNGVGDTMSVTTEPKLTIAANHPKAISPFTVKATLNDCSSNFAQPLAVDIIDLPTIIASSSSGDNGVCKNTDVQLFATSLQGATYEWRILNQNTLISKEQNPVIIGLDATTQFEVKVIPADCDTFSVATIQVEVHDFPSLNPQFLTNSVVCEGGSVQLAANATGNGPFTYAWTGPAGFSASAANPIIGNINNNSLGNYSVTVNDTNNCTATGNISIDAMQAQPEQPIVNPSLTVCANETIELSTLSSYNGTTVTYNWINGLGNTVGTQRTISLAVNHPDAVSPFVLEVTVDGCTSPKSNLINVEVEPNSNVVAIATTSTAFLCKGSTAQLFANQVVGATYEWRILGSPAIISTQQNPEFPNIQNDIEYTVTVKGGGNCNTSEALDTIKITIQKEVDFNLSKDYSLNIDCSPSDLGLNAGINGSDAGLTYLWSGPNNFSSTEKNPIINQVTTDYNGVYTLQIRDSSNCTYTQSITVNDIKESISVPQIVAKNLGCAADNLLLEVPTFNGSGVVYNWFENGTLIGLNNTNQLLVDNAQPGAYYTVNIKVGGCIIESDTLHPFVFGQPMVSIDTVPDVLCSDGLQDITLNANISGGQAPYEIRWSGPNGYVSFSEDPTLLNATSALSGIYSIVVTDQNNCVTQASTALDIIDAPNQPTISMNDLACEGDIIRLNVPDYVGKDVKYSWQAPSTQNLIGQNSNELIISTADAKLHSGTYVLSVEVNGCTSTSEPFEVNLLATPVIRPEANYARTENCAGSDLALKANVVGDKAGLTYKWTGPNGFTSDLENPVIINAQPTHNGSYNLTVSNSLGCTVSESTNLIDNINTTLPQPIIQSDGAVCEGGLMVLTAPIYQGTQVTYIWQKNGENITGQHQNEITIGPLDTQSNVYRVMVLVDDCNLTSNDFTPTVLPVPSLRPDYELSSLCEGGTLQLSANISETATITQYNWTGPNNFTSSLPNPTINNINATNNGDYRLSIRTSTGCERVESVAVTGITNQLVQPTVTTNGPVCADENIELGIQETINYAGTNFYWLNGRGDTIGREKNIQLAATDALAISPYQAVITLEGCPTVTSVAIPVDIIRLPTIITNNNGPICQMGSVQLMATEVRDAQYLWINSQTGDTISTEINPIVQNIDTTTVFELRIKKNSCEVESIFTTRVDVIPPLEIDSISSTLVICEGQDLTLSAKSNNQQNIPIAYSWTGPNDFQFTAETTTNQFEVTIPQFTANQAGSYELTIGLNASCNTISRSVVVSVSEALITPTLQAASGIVCGGEDILLTASTENGPNAVYEWFKQNEAGDLFLINQTNTPSLLINEVDTSHSAEYLVRVTNNGCNSGFSNTIPITVISFDAVIAAQNNTSALDKACVGSVIQLSVPFYEGATYSWFGPAGFSSDKPNPIINPATELAAGAYFAIISFENCVSLTSTTTEVFVKPSPETPSIRSNSPVCEGETIVLELNSPLSNDVGDSLVFEWYNAGTNTLIATTNNPNLVLENGKDSLNGSYYLRLSINGCQANPSNMVEIKVLNNITLNAYAGLDQTHCTAALIDLMANEVENATGTWTSPTGASIANPNNATTQANDLQAGENLFVWTVQSNICGVAASDTVKITIGTVNKDHAFAGVDQNICEDSSFNLTATPLVEAMGLWTQSSAQMSQGITITDPTSPNTMVEGLEPGNTYVFTWTISQGNCANFDSDEVQLNISDIPTENALIGTEEVILCDEDQLNLEAEIPTLSTGMWHTTSGAVFADRSAPNTFVENLDRGRNVFVWKLSNGACEDFSQDSIIVYSEGKNEINADRYVVELGDSITFNVLSNDIISAPAYDLIITKYPERGELEVINDSTFKYKPLSTFFGLDDFRYKICSQTCEELCDTAIVYLQIGTAQGANPGCPVPNVISPNNDGNNDVFLVTCIDDFPNNQLRIFNRFGDKVFDQRNYDNKWAGTFEGQPLPAGTYFYILQLGENIDPIQGFITIFR